MKIVSPVFEDNGIIPSKYSCLGQNVNPPLGFEDVPAEAMSLVLTLEDPDAPGGTFTHWLIWNIDPESDGIPENSVPLGAKQGKNSADNNGYTGPCPPFGTHRYLFTLYALDTPIDNLSSLSTSRELKSAISGHVISEAQTIGLFSR